MKLPVSRSVLSSLWLLFCGHLPAADGLTLDIDIRGRAEQPAFESTIAPEQAVYPVTDSGQLLRQATGATASRKGGKGFEPVIRGQQQSQLNIIQGDAYVLAACPGRMDPPAGYAVMAGYDRVRVLQGYESVTHGSGGSGGTVLFERDDPDLSGKPVRGRAGFVFTDNIDSRKTSADASAGNNNAYLRVYGEHQKAGNYRDGAGNTVSSAFRSDSGGVVLSGHLLPFTRAELNVEAVRDDDVHYAGNGMDAPWAKADTWRMKVSHEDPFAGLDALEVSAYSADVQHLMDNYSVRRRQAQSPTGLKAPSFSKTWGGRLLGTAFHEKSELNIGLDYRASDQNAERYRVDLANGSEALQSHIWPAVEYRQVGMFAELDYDLTPRDTVRAGVRYDHFTAEATKAGRAALGSNSPNALYQRYYGVQAENVKENNISGLLGWQHEVSPARMLEFRLSRVVRTADATERYLASRGSCCHGSDDMVGNPEIKPEVHHQLDAGYRYRMKNGELGISVYLDEVQDYIWRDQAESGALLFKNVDACLYGIELDASSRFGRIKPSLGLAWTRGENRTTGGHLPQIPPLTATFKLDYDAQRWLLGARWELAARQDRVDTQGGLDAGKTAGYGVVHLHGWYQLGPGFKIQGGIENLFDKTYALHVNRASRDPFNPEAIRVNEPGRQLWLGISIDF